MFEQGEAVHLRHVDVCKHHVDVGILIESLEGFDAIVGKGEQVLPGTHIAAHALPHQVFEVGFIVNH